MSLSPGFIGVANINGVYVRCTSITMNVKQDTMFYDHYLGLRDSIPTDGLTTKNEKTSEIPNYQKMYWRPGVKIVNGGISFPVVNDNFTGIFDLARNGTSFPLEIIHDCNMKRTYPVCKINNFKFLCTAGDICNVTLDIIGSGLTETISQNPLTPLVKTPTVDKLITWDEIGITPYMGVGNSMVQISDPVQEFDFSINNNCKPIYTANGDLFPSDIRVGMQDVTGSISFYKRGTGINTLSDLTTGSRITFNLGTFFTKEMSVIFKPIERTSGVKSLISTLPFVGIDRPFEYEVPGS